MFEGVNCSQLNEVRFLLEGHPCAGEIRQLSDAEKANYNAALAAILPHAQTIQRLTNLAADRFAK